MKTVHVSAEREYDVVIDCNWHDEFLQVVAGRSRVAIVVSTALRSRISDLPSIDAEVHIFEIADGEEGKAVRCWNRSGITWERRDLHVAIC